MELAALIVVVLLVGPPLVIGAAGLSLLAAAIFGSGSRRVRETFRCPVTGRVVTADFVVREGAEHPAEVASCTAFPKRAKIACKKDCREFADVRWGLSRAVFPRWALTAGGPVTWRNAA